MSAIATHSGNERQVVEYIQVAGDHVESVKTQSFGEPKSFGEVRADIQKKINEKFSEGYSLYGNLEYNVDPKGKYGNATHFMIQAMVKYA